MEAAGARRLDVSGEARALEQLPQGSGGVTHRREVGSGRVEVEDEAVGTVEPADLREPDVRRDAGLADEVYERLRVLDDDMRDGAAGLALDASSGDELREPVGRALLVDLLAVDPVREPLHVHRPSPDVREHRLPDPRVVAREIGLRQPIGEEGLSGV